MGGKEGVVIVGAGIAGTSTAYFLARKGVHNITLLETESVAGSSSSGRNAAILRSAIPDAALRGLARESARFYRDPPKGFTSRPLLNRVGVYLVALAEHQQSLLSWAIEGKGSEDTRLVDPQELYARVPVLAPGITAALHAPDDGVMDVHEILQSFLNGASQAGAVLRLGCTATCLRVKGDKIVGVETSDGPLEAGMVVLAGGGWAALIAGKSGCPMPLVPHRRHLLVTNPLPQVDPRWPVVWCEGIEFYFRPESGGLLMCGCDTVPVSAEEGEKTDPNEIERIALKAHRWLPSLINAGVARAWAGMRTFAPDHRFVIGPDPRVQGLHWAAGLGGHGITCAPAVGRLAAEWIVEGKSDHPAATVLLPGRFLQ
ncbi:MAG TPA: FAD-dependent oxidoreductase [Acidobacteriota bacterium]|nr:FAD-dependent oxidoreductase [Acidobacteriota bacterium]